MSLTKAFDSTFPQQYAMKHISAKKNLKKLSTVAFMLNGQ